LTSDEQKIGGGELSDADAHVGRNRSERKWFYLVGLIVIFGSMYSQYLGVNYGLIPGILIVYGVPILIITLLWKTTIISRFFNRTPSALKIGLGYFGAFTVLGIFVGVVILIVLLLFDPNTLNLLDKPNPVLNIPSGLAWFMVAGSLLIVGPAEEYIFRGFVFGGLLELFKNRHWLSLAFVSSLLFGAVHLYYAITYGIASLILFTDLMTFGMAMAITYYLSGGNLFAPSLIHGAYDATAFVGVATTQGTGTLLRGLMIVIGLVAGLILLLERVRKKSSPPPDLDDQRALEHAIREFIQKHGGAR
jgi:membrane protease YdiL (CAAX protease family)